MKNEPITVLLNEKEVKEILSGYLDGMYADLRVDGVELITDRKQFKNAVISFKRKER